MIEPREHLPTAGQLEWLAAELRAVAQSLQQEVPDLTGLAPPVAQPAAATGPVLPVGSGAPSFLSTLGQRRAAVAQRLLKALSDIPRQFPLRIFGDGAWLIMLDLFVMEQAGRQVTITSAQIASCTPMTTARRHISELIAAGLVLKRNSPEDQRVTYLALSDLGRARLEGWIDRWLM